MRGRRTDDAAHSSYLKLNSTASWGMVALTRNTTGVGSNHLKGEAEGDVLRSGSGHDTLEGDAGRSSAFAIDAGGDDKLYAEDETELDAAIEAGNDANAVNGTGNGNDNRYAVRDAQVASQRMRLTRAAVVPEEKKQKSNSSAAG